MKIAEADEVVIARDPEAIQGLLPGQAVVQVMVVTTTERVRVPQTSRNGSTPVGWVEAVMNTWGVVRLCVYVCLRVCV